MRYALSLLLAAFLIAAPARAQVWDLVWADEFDEPGLPNPDRWSYDVGGGGWGNSELQFYTDARAENARVEDGHLIIEARKEDFEGRNYTSARLVTRDKGDWRYGRVEVMARLPEGRGSWPAIWMLPTEWGYGDGGWPDNGEIDIMEHVGYDQGRVHGTVHTGKYNHTKGTQKGGNRVVGDVADAFHLYAIEWSPRKIDFFIDGDNYFSFFNDRGGWPSWPFDQPFHLLLNIAVGGSWGGAQGVDDTIFPQQMAVDYVRVFRNTAVPEVALTAPAGATGAPGETVTVAADATDADGRIIRVTFYQGDGVLGSDASAPYELAIAGAAEGCYRLSADAVDEQGWVTRTDAVDFKVGETCGQAPYLMVPPKLPGAVEAANYDLGGPGEAYLDITAGNDGGAMRTDEGVDIGDGSDVLPVRYVGWIANREWMEYTVDVAQPGRYTIRVRVASASANGAFSLFFDDVDITGTVTFDATGGDQTWETVRIEDVDLEAGRHVMRFRARSSGFNVHRFNFDFMSGVGREDDAPDGPGGLGLAGNHPNPFGGATTIAYTLPSATPVVLAVYDVLGRRLATLVDGVQPAGRHDAVFDATGLPPGLYLYRLTTPTAQRTDTMLLLR